MSEELPGYIVVEGIISYHPNENWTLAYLVNQEIMRGYTPLGGVSILREDVNAIAPLGVQAMVLSDKG